MKFRSHTLPMLLAMLLLILPALHSRADDSGDFSHCLTINGYGSDSMFSEPSAFALDDRAGELYIADTKAGNIDVFTLQGVPVSQYGLENGLRAPFGVAVDGKGNIYVSESKGGPIKIINTKGETSELEVPAGDDKITPKPGRMTFDQDGNLYVVDRATNRILVFDKDRKIKLRIGGTGNKRGQFKKLQDMAVDLQGRVYALDSEGSTPVQVFDKKGKYLYKFGFQGDGDEDISVASSVFIDCNDQIWVVDKGQHALKVFDQSGTFLRTFGSYGVGESTLFYPVDAAVDSMGQIYVLEAGGRRLQVFSMLHPYEPFTPPGL